MADLHENMRTEHKNTMSFVTAFFKEVRPCAVHEWAHTGPLVEPINVCASVTHDVDAAVLISKLALCQACPPCQRPKSDPCNPAGADASAVRPGGRALIPVRIFYLLLVALSLASHICKTCMRFLSQRSPTRSHGVLSSLNARHAVSSHAKHCKMVRRSHSRAVHRLRRFFPRADLIANLAAQRDGNDMSMG